MYLYSLLLLLIIKNVSATIKFRRTNLEEVMRQRLHETIQTTIMNDKYHVGERRNEECDNYYGYYNYTNYYGYQGFILDDIVSQQCAATTAVAFYSPKIYNEDTIAEIEEAIELSVDNVTATFCLDGSCDNFEKDCLKYGGHFVTANFTTYSPCNECEVQFIDINYPLCLGWDCDDTEIQDFVNYIGKIQACDDGEDVPVEMWTYGGEVIDSYPNDTNDVCYVDMLNLFFYTEVYGNDEEFDYANMNEILCEANDGVIWSTTIADTTQQNDQCVNLIDVPLCYPASCTVDEAANMFEFYFNDVSIMNEEEGCQSVDVTISTIAPTISSSPSISLSSVPTISSSPTIILSSVPTISMSPSLSPSPTDSPTISDTPTDSSKPSTSPSISLAPSVNPSLLASSFPSAFPTQTPSTSKRPSAIPSQSPSKSLFPSLNPSSLPSLLPTNAPTASPSSSPTPAPTFAPTNAPTALPTFAKTLNDSPLPFRFEQEYYTCADVGTVGGTVTCDSRNDIAGDVKTHCPATCSAADVYESNMYVDFGIVQNGGEIKPKQCRPWLSQEDWSKCTERCAGGKDGNKIGIRDTCENSCSTCELIAMDSPLPFRFQGAYHECADVSDNGPVTCDTKGDIAGTVAKHCSATCGSFDESDMYVDVGIVKKGKIRPKQCLPWISQKKWSKCVQRCNRPEVRQTCPKSCWECDGRQAI